MNITLTDNNEDLDHWQIDPLEEALVKQRKLLLQSLEGLDLHPRLNTKLVYSSCHFCLYNNIYKSIFCLLLILTETDCLLLILIEIDCLLLILTEVECVVYWH